MINPLDNNSNLLPDLKGHNSHREFVNPIPFSLFPSNSHGLVFHKNLEAYIIHAENLEKSAKNKMTLMKVLFIGLLVLGTICAASFFLLPVLGNIAAALGLSVAATTIAWQTIFLGGGLLAGLSFLPRRFIKGFEKDKNQYHQKAETLKELIKGDFREFLDAELTGKYKHPEVIAGTSDFAELFYLMQNVNNKKSDVQRHEQELLHVRDLIKLREGLVGKEQKNHIELEEKVSEVTNKLQEMKREVQELENDAHDLRSNLAELDRKV